MMQRIQITSGPLTRTDAPGRRVGPLDDAM